MYIYLFFIYIYYSSIYCTYCLIPQTDTNVYMFHNQNWTWNRVLYAVAIIYINIRDCEFKYKINPKDYNLSKLLNSFWSPNNYQILLIL